MICLKCGRILKSEKSRELGYGPVCYKSLFGSARKSRPKKQPMPTDDFPYYDIPGQMSLDDFLRDE